MSVVVSIFIPPLLPAWHAEREITRLPSLVTTRQARERLAARRHLYAAIGPHRQPVAARPSHVPLARPGARAPVIPETRPEISVKLTKRLPPRRFAS